MRLPVFDRAWNALMRLPGWLHAPVVGMTFIVGLTLFRVLFAWRRFVARPHELAGLVVIAAAAGFVAGLAYSVLGSRLRRIPHFGPYVAGIAIAVVYVGLVAVVASFTTEPVVRDDTWLPVLGTTVLLGAGVGHVLFKD